MGNERRKLLSTHPGFKMNFPGPPGDFAGVRQIFPPEVGQTLQNMKFLDEIYVAEIDGFLSGLTFHTIIYGQNYDVKSFETAENGPYYDIAWTRVS